MKCIYYTQSWHFLPQKSEQDPAKAHMTHFSWSSCCFIHSHPLSWQQQLPGWFSGLCQGPFCHPYCCLLCLCLDLALPSTKRLVSFKSNKKSPDQLLSMLSTYAYTLTSLEIIYLAIILSEKLKQLCAVHAIYPLSLTLTAICCITLKKTEHLCPNYQGHY